MKQTIFLLIVIISLNSKAEGTSSGTYEDDQVTRLVQTYAQGGIVWLGSGDKTFLSLYQESEQGQNRAAIILHSMGMHADWPELISPIRKQLPKSGWATLSVQLPLLDPQTGLAEYGGTFKLANERIRSAILYLMDRGYVDIVIIAYNFGATTAVNYLTDYSNVVKAFIGISMQPHRFLKPKYDLIEALSNLKIPALDIFGGNDYTGVLKSTNDRRLAANKAGNVNYNQIMIREANHYFTGMETDLIREIVRWLELVIPDDY